MLIRLIKTHALKFSSITYKFDFLAYEVNLVIKENCLGYYICSIFILNFERLFRKVQFTFIQWPILQDKLKKRRFIAFSLY